MHLVEILLPVTDSVAFPAEIERLGRQLTEKFGGVTAFARSPGDGAWQDGAMTKYDTIIVLEVMTKDLDRSWWRDLRAALESRLDQEEIVIRTHMIDKL